MGAEHDRAAGFYVLTDIGETEIYLMLVGLAALVFLGGLADRALAAWLRAPHHRR
jgi:hypothetical protein